MWQNIKCNVIDEVYFVIEYSERSHYYETQSHLERTLSASSRGLLVSIPPFMDPMLLPVCNGTPLIGSEWSVGHFKCITEHLLCAHCLLALCCFQNSYWAPVVDFLYEHTTVHGSNALRGMVKNLPLLRRAGYSGHPWVHAIMYDNTYSDIRMVIHASTL